MLSNQGKNIVLLDFDGVLCDSVKEAFILSRFAFENIQSHEEVEIDLYEKFKKYRYLVQNSWQYYFIYLILKNFPNESKDFIESKFHMLCAHDKSLSDDFNNVFLMKRKDMMINDIDFWHSLETPTSFLNDLRNILNDKYNCQFAILSTKNKEAIVKKFNFWNIPFEENFIFDKSDLLNINKGDFINNFLKKNIYSKAILIDDNQENINSCSGILNLSAYLANWGYVESRPVCTNEDEILKLIGDYL
jgi:hypothetical protein